MGTDGRTSASPTKTRIKQQTEAITNLARKCLTCFTGLSLGVSFRWDHVPSLFVRKTQTPSVRQPAKTEQASFVHSFRSDRKGLYGPKFVHLTSIKPAQPDSRSDARFGKAWKQACQPAWIGIGYRS